MIIGDDEMNHDGQKTRRIDIPGCVGYLSNFERLWSLANVAMIARIIGDVSKADLKQALDKVRYMHPLIGSRIIFDDRNVAWLSIDAVPETVLRIVSRTSETQWLDEIRHENMMPFEREKGPMIRFIHLYSPKVSELIVFANHSICDGMSLAILIRDILICYSEPLKEAQVLYPPTMADHIPRGSLLSRLAKKAIIGYYNSQWKKRLHYLSQADYNELIAFYWGKYQSSIVLLQLGLDETFDLIARCRENGSTVGSALTAAFLAAYQDVIGPFPKKRRRITIAYDLRRHLRECVGDVFCFFAWGTTFPFSYDGRKSFWKNAQDLHVITQKKVDKLDASNTELFYFDPGLIDAFNLAPFLQIVPEAFDRTEKLAALAQDTKNSAFSISRKFMSIYPSAGITNLGSLDFPVTYGNLRLDLMVFVPPASPFAPLIIGGISVGGKLVFSLNYVEHMGGDGSLITADMIKIRNRALEYLGFPGKVNDKAI